MIKQEFDLQVVWCHKKQGPWLFPRKAKGGGHTWGTSDYEKREEIVVVYGTPCGRGLTCPRKHTRAPGRLWDGHIPGGG